MPKKQTTKQIVDDEMSEVFRNTPSTVDTSKSTLEQRKQQIAIGLSKARARGARVPRKPTP